MALLCFASADAQTERRRLGTAGGGSAKAYDTGAAGDQASGATLTIPITIASDANYCLVGASVYLSGGGTATATVDGASMTQLGDEVNSDDHYYLWGKASPTTGSVNVVITPSSSSCEIAGVVMTIKNVSSTSNYTEAEDPSASTYIFSVTPPANTGSWGAGVLFAYNKTVDVVSNGVERVTNENGASYGSAWGFTRDGSGQMNGEFSGSVGWVFLSIRLD